MISIGPGTSNTLVVSLFYMTIASFFQKLIIKVTVRLVSTVPVILPYCSVLSKRNCFLSALFYWSLTRIFTLLLGSLKKTLECGCKEMQLSSTSKHRSYLCTLIRLFSQTIKVQRGMEDPPLPINVNFKLL